MHLNIESSFFNSSGGYCAKREERVNPIRLKNYRLEEHAVKYTINIMLMNEKKTFIELWSES